MDTKERITIYYSQDETDINRVAVILREQGVECSIFTNGSDRTNNGQTEYELSVLLEEKENALGILKNMLDFDPQVNMASGIYKTAPKENMNYGATSIILSLFWVFGFTSLLAVYYGIKELEQNHLIGTMGILFGTLGAAVTLVVFNNLLRPVLSIFGLILALKLLFPGKKKEVQTDGK